MSHIEMSKLAGSAGSGGRGGRCTHRTFPCSQNVRWSQDVHSDTSSLRGGTQDSGSANNNKMQLSFFPFFKLLLILVIDSYRMRQKHRQEHLMPESTKIC